MKRLSTTIATLFALVGLVPVPALAQCPVCAVGAVIGVGFARWLGVDDLISGTWVGGMMVALTAWTIVWLNKKNIRFKGRILLTTFVYYVLFLYLPLWLWAKDLLTNPLAMMWGVNKFFVGTILGSVVFFAANLWYRSIKRRHGGHAQFLFQKVVWPVGALLLLSAVLYVLIPYIPTY